MNPYDITAEPMFKHLFGDFAENSRNPNYDTSMDELKKLEIKAEAERLLASDELLEDVDEDRLERIYKKHRLDLLDLGEKINEYFRKCAMAQAERNHE